MSQSTSSIGTPMSSGERELLGAIACAPPVKRTTSLSADTNLGRYAIRTEIGRGAGGVVYEALDQVLERRVALKVLRAERLEKEGRGRLLREARAAARVRHRNVAAIFDVAEIDGHLVLAMELIEGATLRARLSRSPKLTPSEAASLLADVADAAHAAHRADVVHRDLKPDNIMLDSDGSIKVLDFGLASLADNGTVNVGTPGYTAPETRTGYADARSDQYAIGVMLIELLTGARPRDPSSTCPKLPGNFGRIALRATARNPAERFPSCEALALALREKRRPVGRWILAGLGLITVLTVATTMPQTGPKETAHARAQPPPGLATQSPTQAPITCPPLETATTSDGWLGAAAASAVCRRVRAVLGGGRATVVPPAELAGLPRTPGEQFPKDPYLDPQTRAHALKASNGHPSILGSVRFSGRRLDLEITLIDASGAAVATGRGAGGFASSVAAAVDQLVQHGGLAPASIVDARISLATGITDPRALVALTDGWISVVTGGDGLFARSRLATCGAACAPESSLILDTLTRASGDATALTPPPPLPNRDPRTVLQLGALHINLGGDANPKDLADILAAASLDALAPLTRADLSAKEAELRSSAGDMVRARELALAAMDDDPWDGPWSTLVHSGYQQQGFGEVARAYSAWLPEVADAWNIAGHVDRTSSEDRLALIERGYLLGDGFPLFAGNYGAFLILLGRREEARTVSSLLSVGTKGQRIAGARLAANIDLSEGKVAGAYERAWLELERLDSVGTIDKGDIALLGLYIELGVLLDRGPDAAANVAETFILAEPSRLDHGPVAAVGAAHACAYAAPSVAERCFDRLVIMLDSGWFPAGVTPDTRHYVEGARAFAMSDYTGAAAHFRRVRSTMMLERSVAALAFEHAGDLTNADRVDPVQPGMFAGISASWYRNARRAYERKDCEQTTELAGRIVKEWSSADHKLTAVTDAQRLLAQCTSKHR